MIKIKDEGDLEKASRQQQQQQIQQNANHGQQRIKPPPLIKTIIYEEENENELYEQQIREERENAKKIHEQEEELQHQQDGVMVELVPESPDYATKYMSEEISEAHIVSEHDIMNNIPDVLIATTTSEIEKNHEIHVEVISTIEPDNIQIVPVDCNDCNRSATIDPELD